MFFEQVQSHLQELLNQIELNQTMTLWLSEYDRIKFKRAVRGEICREQFPNNERFCRKESSPLRLSFKNSTIYTNISHLTTSVKKNSTYDPFSKLWFGGEPLDWQSLCTSSGDGKWNFTVSYFQTADQQKLFHTLWKLSKVKICHHHGTIERIKR